MKVASEPQTIVLRDGLSVRLAALRLLWQLEERGFAIDLDDEWLRVKPRHWLTADDDAAIREHRDELVALVGYCDVRM